MPERYPCALLSVVIPVYNEIETGSKSVLTWKAVRAWYVYNRLLLKHLACVPPADRILVSYNRLIDFDDELERLSRFVGLPLEDVRRAPTSRSASGLRYSASVWLQRAFRKRDVDVLLDQLRDLSSVQPCLGGGDVVPLAGVTRSRTEESTLSDSSFDRVAAKI